MWPVALLRRALTSVSLLTYVVWLLATVLLMGARLGLLPKFTLAHQTVVAGAAVLTVFGVGQLGRKGLKKLRRVVD